MAEVKWIKITTNMFDDEKIKLIESMPERDTILIVWIKLLTLAGRCNASGHLILSDTIAYTDEMLSTIFNRPLSSLRLALEVFSKFNMIECSETIQIANWEKHQNAEGLEKIREQNRLRKQRQREKDEKEQLALMSRDSSRDVTQQNKNKNKNKNIKTYVHFFENAWSFYPNKKGKGSVSESKKKELEKLGDEFTRCIQRYKKEIDTKNIGSQFIKHGSTFFNSGYIDYLDANYEEMKAKECPYKEVD